MMRITWPRDITTAASLAYMRHRLFRNTREFAMRLRILAPTLHVACRLAPDNGRRLLRLFTSTPEVRLIGRSAAMPMMITLERPF